MDSNAGPEKGDKWAWLMRNQWDFLQVGQHLLLLDQLETDRPYHLLHLATGDFTTTHFEFHITVFYAPFARIRVPSFCFIRLQVSTKLSAVSRLWVYGALLLKLLNTPIVTLFQLIHVSCISKQQFVDWNIFLVHIFWDICQFKKFHDYFGTFHQFKKLYN